MNLRSITGGDLLDKTGAAVSWVCAVHCLAMPMLVSFLPIAGLSFLDNEAAEYGIIGISVLIAAISLFPSYFRDHRRLRAIAIFVSGLGLLLLADYLFEESMTGKTITLMAGALTISIAHMINRKMCRECRLCGNHESHST
jgi:uncharacterized membrane protein